MPDRNWIHGHTVDKDGNLRYVSASALQKADMSTDQGCERLWWYTYVDGKKEPETKRQAEGKRYHAEIETYELSGVRALSARVLGGLHAIPEPGPDLWVERDLIPPMPDGSSGLHLAPLKIDGIPFVGSIDLSHARGTNKGAEDITLTIDPPGTREVLDWKFVGSLRYAVPGHDLIKTIQMASYANYVTKVEPDIALIRLSHVYFPPSGAARKMSALVDRRAIERAWEHPTSVARSVRDVARETNPEKVPANTRACVRYNRECMHRPYCSAGTHNSLADFFGQTAAEELLQLARRPTPTGDKKDMTLVPTPNGSLTGILTTLGPVASVLGAPATPVAPAAPDPEALARLAEQEAAARDPALHAVCAAITATNHGFPALAGAAAAAYARMRNTPITPGAGLAGSGDLGKYTLTDPAHFAVLLDEIPRFTGWSNAAPAAPAAPAPTLGQIPVALLPPDSPEPVMPQAPVAETPAPQQDAAGALAATLAQADDKPRRGRPKKNATAPTAAATTAAPSSVPADVAPPATDASAQAVAEDADRGQTVIYIDAIPSCEHKSIWPLVYSMLEALGKKSNSPSNDPRLAPKESSMGFGAWKAALTAFIVETGVEEGHWVLDGAFGDVAQAAIEAFHKLALRHGYLVIRGTR